MRPAVAILPLDAAKPLSDSWELNGPVALATIAAAPPSPLAADDCKEAVP